MAKFSTKVAARVTTQLKRYQSVLAGLLKRDVSEADTVTVVNDMLSDIAAMTNIYMSPVSTRSAAPTWILP
jgi:hypothetical protein